MKSSMDQGRQGMDTTKVLYWTLKIIELKARSRKAGLDVVEITPSGRLKAFFSSGMIPGRKLLADIAATFEGRLTFHTEGSFSMSVEGPGGTGGAVSDLESLLNLLEFYVN